MTVYEQMLAERGGRAPGVVEGEQVVRPVIEPSAVVTAAERVAARRRWRETLKSASCSDRRHATGAHRRASA
jgi:hypothetical protein